MYIYIGDQMALVLVVHIDKTHSNNEAVCGSASVFVGCSSLKIDWDVSGNFMSNGLNHTTKKKLYDCSSQKL